MDKFPQGSRGKPTLCCRVHPDPIKKHQKWEMRGWEESRDIPEFVGQVTQPTILREGDKSCQFSPFLFSISTMYLVSGHFFPFQRGRERRDLKAKLGGVGGGERDHEEEEEKNEDFRGRG